MEKSEFLLLTFMGTSAMVVHADNHHLTVLFTSTSSTNIKTFSSACILKQAFTLKGESFNILQFRVLKVIAQIALCLQNKGN